jgi:hypothetical protein
MGRWDHARPLIPVASALRAGTLTLALREFEPKPWPFNLCERLTAGTHTPEHCIEVAFQFPLDREPKVSILRRFDVTGISRYSPSGSRRSREPSALKCTI